MKVDLGEELQCLKPNINNARIDYRSKVILAVLKQFQRGILLKANGKLQTKAVI